MDIKELKREGKEKALDSLGRYKFMMFGYWAAIWVYFNKLDDNREANPFEALVRESRRLKLLLNERATVKATLERLPVIDDPAITEALQDTDCEEHDYVPTFQGGDTYRCAKCGHEIDMTEDEDGY